MPPQIGGHFGRSHERGWRAWRAYSKTCAELPTRLVRISSRETYAKAMLSMILPTLRVGRCPRSGWRGHGLCGASCPLRRRMTTTRKALPSGGVQLIGCVQGADRELGVFGRHQDADLDLGGRDHLDVYPLGGKGLAHLERHAGVAAHADADHRDLGDVD